MTNSNVLLFFSNWAPDWEDDEETEACAYLKPYIDQQTQSATFYWNSGSCETNLHWICRFPPYCKYGLLET